MTNIPSYNEPEFRGDHGVLRETAQTCDEFIAQMRSILLKEKYIQSDTPDREMLRAAGERIGLPARNVNAVVTLLVNFRREFVVQGVRMFLMQSGAEVYPDDSLDTLLALYENLLEKEDTVLENEDNEKNSAPRSLVRTELKID